MSSQIVLEERAGELQVRLLGDFGGSLVNDLNQAWRTAQDGLFWRHVIVDLSNLSTLDSSAKELLREMYRRGVLFTAGNSEALDLLHQISSRIAIPVEGPQPADAEHQKSEEIARPRIHPRRDRYCHVALSRRAFSEVS